MRRLRLYLKIFKDFLSCNIVQAEDIGRAYDKVSNTYDESFLNVMQQYNIKLLSLLELPKEGKILDLACGTGFNSEYLLSQRYNLSIDAVDISEGMLKKARTKLNGKVNFYKDSMLDFLGKCPDNTYDIVVCCWALKYQSPMSILKECSRLLKAGGQMAVIVNSKDTLPEMRIVYKNLIFNNSEKINKLMKELPNPRNEIQFKDWFIKAGFENVETYRGKHRFNFDSKREMTKWVTSTGALAGFDVMLDLSRDDIKEQIINLLEDNKIDGITHDFIWGVAKK